MEKKELPCGRAAQKSLLFLSFRENCATMADNAKKQETFRPRRPAFMIEE